MLHSTIALLMQLAQNPMFSGIVAASALGAAAWALKEVPVAIWNKCVSSMSRQISIYNDGVAFEWFERWLAGHSYTTSLWCRTLRLTIEPSNTVEHYDYDKVLSPGYGSHLMFYKGWPIFLHRHIDSEGPANLNTNKKSERLELRIFFGPRRILMEMIDEAEANAKMSRGRVPLNMWMLGWWAKAPPLRPRALSTVYLPDGQIESIMEDAEAFTHAADWYMRVGVPFRRGYLFSGSPGTGKTTVAIAMASYLQRPLYSIALSTVSDTDLALAVLSIPRNGILLLEDVDTLKQTGSRISKEDKTVIVENQGDEPKLTLGGLLNAVDGVFSNEGRILIMTTNYPEKLDPALIRPGRVDYKLDFGKVGGEVIARMFNNFYHSGFTAAQFQDLEQTPAAVQGVLLSNRNAPDAALTALMSTREQEAA